MSSSHNLVQAKFEKHILEEAGNLGEALSEKLVPVITRRAKERMPLIISKLIIQYMMHISRNIFGFVNLPHQQAKVKELNKV